jgi:hypothetical protein
MKTIKYLFLVLLSLLPGVLFADGLAPNGTYPASLPPSSIASITSVGNVTNNASTYTIFPNGNTLILSNATVRITNSTVTISNNTTALNIAGGDLIASNGVFYGKQAVFQVNAAGGFYPISAYGFTPASPPLLDGVIMRLYSANNNHSIGLEGGGAWFSSDGQINYYYMNGGTAAKKFSFGVSSGVFQVNGSGGLRTVIDTNAVHYGDGSGLTNITPVITNFTSYAAGTAYTLTASAAQLAFGTTSPGITIQNAGTYLIQANAGIKYNAATYAGAQTITLKLRRTNNTAADLTNGSRAVELPVLTTFTGGDVMCVPPVVYTASAGDVVQLWGSVSATPSAGSVLSDSAEIVAIRLY